MAAARYSLLASGSWRLLTMRNMDGLCPNPDCELLWHDAPESRCPGSDRTGVMLSVEQAIIRDARNEQKTKFPPSKSPWEVLGYTSEAATTVGSTFATISDTFNDMAKTLGITIDGFSLKYVLWPSPMPGVPWQDVNADAEIETDPKQRALPRPSKTPPMWAVDPTKSRRKR